MKKKITLFLCVSVITVFFLCETRIQASLPVHPVPWEIVFEEANMIFYMTPPQRPPEDQMRFFRIPEISEERMQIRTGLYCGTTLEIIYYIDINAHRGSVFFSSCGKYIATMQNTVDNFDNENLGGGLINFFSNGILVKSYGVEDLRVNENNLPWTSAGVFWRYQGSSAFDLDSNFNMQENTLTVKTGENNVFVFDITTGEIIGNSGWRAWLQSTVFFAIVTVVFVGVVMFLLVRRKRAV